MRAAAASPAVTWVDHIGVPPGARVEFIVDGPPVGVPALLVTRTVDTGQGGENDPNRALASIARSCRCARAAVEACPRSRRRCRRPRLPWLGDVTPVRVRKLYFSEKLADPNDPNSATDFYITVDGKTPAPFDPHRHRAEHRRQAGRRGGLDHREPLHRAARVSHPSAAFHAVDWSGMPVNEPFLRDTVNVPYFNGRMLQYPSVRLRMDFRDPNIVGTFVYHCHLLEHEDGGMMGTIRVEPAACARSAPRDLAVRAGTHPVHELVAMTVRDSYNDQLRCNTASLKLLRTLCAPPSGRLHECQRIVSQTLQRSRLAAVSLAVLQLSVGPVLAAPRHRIGGLESGADEATDARRSSTSS